ncbi:hypothetical protein DAEQUDRAFT_759451 [Daedalea quercina L-15889]|uniref:Uncharacterized protein n=1 Tax=Daedalea quercina L-15889 TaxID=1314783 RepID=A0A165M7L7_9APHY|nr:hypothetical protein DAEQUDRAFT_759451 [Daedalea quercina L-15889]
MAVSDIKLSEVRAYVFFSNDMAWAATDKEIEYFWCTRWSLNRVLFVGYRYPALLNMVLEFLTNLTLSWQNYWRCETYTSACDWLRTMPMTMTSGHSCGILLHFQMTLTIIISVSGTSFAALRVYALFNYNRALFAVVLLSGLLNPAIFVYIFTRSIPARVSTIQGCSLSIVGGSRSYEKGTMLARAASVLSDGIVLVLTLMKTHLKSDDVTQLSQLNRNVRGILLRNSSVCFAFLCVINVIGIGTARMTVTIQIIQTWISILTSVLLSRLALDLRETTTLELADTTEIAGNVTLETLDFVHRTDDLDSESESEDADIQAELRALDRSHTVEC